MFTSSKLWRLTLVKCLRGYSTSLGKSYDVVFAGGGAMGLCCAYFLAKRTNPSTICVIERDPNYAHNSAVLSWGSIRQQFSITENIQMSQFGFHFLQNADKYLAVEGEPVDLQFKHGTYCFLATRSGIDQLKENAEIQRATNVPISLLRNDELASKYPWLNTEDIEMASNVSYGEGWFDPWSFLASLKKKLCSMGVHFIEGEVKAIDKDNNNKIKHVKVLTKTNSTDLETLMCGNLVNTAGAWANSIAQMIGIDLPVHPSKRVTFVIHNPDGFTDPVLLIDSSQNIFIRPEGFQQYILGTSPDEEEFKEDFEIDHDIFQNELWPKLAYRIPAFEKLKVINAWAGLYDYNIVDQNGIISTCPGIKNLFFANGFSGHGIQQAPAVGRGISELILDGKFQTIDLTRYSYERFHDNKLLIERNVV